MRWKRRRRARRLLVQALYQQQLTGHTADEIEAQFLERPELKEADGEFFTAQLHEICSRLEELDHDIATASEIPPDRIDPVERAILWAALSELQTRKVRGAVVINEAIELTRTFGADHGYRFVNAVLDRWARTNLPETVGKNSEDGD